jgi:hypothetical protein
MFDAVSLDELNEVMATAAGSDVADLSADVLVGVAEGIERLQRFVDATRVNVLAQLDADDTTDERFGLRTARWLEHHAVVPGAAANQRVRVARRLHQVLPCTRRALVEGRITHAHAVVMCRAAGNLRIVERFLVREPELVALAEVKGFEAWKREVDEIVARLDADGGHDPDDFDPARNRLFFNQGYDGQLEGHFAFAGPHAAEFEEIVNRAAERIRRQFHNDAEVTAELEVPSWATLRALALAELVRHGHQAHAGGTASEPAADITIVCEVDDITRAATSIFGARLSDRLMEFLGCNASFSTLLVDSLGVPLDLGREARYANRDQRRALLHQHHGTCAFPGCSVPLHRCDVHHVVVWDKGGRTDMVNLIPLCRHHHGVTHRHGWELVTNPDRTHTWTTPLGEQLHSRPPPGTLVA